MKEVFFTLIVYGIFIIPPLYVAINFLNYLIYGKVICRNKLWVIVQFWIVIIIPCIVLFVDTSRENDCCSETAIFSPNHRLLLYILIGACMLAYMISITRKKIFPPVLELVLQSFLILGFIINIILCKHITAIHGRTLVWVIGNVPILLLFLISICENQKLLKNHIQKNKLQANNLIGKMALSILSLKAIYKYPILTLCLIPIIIALSMFLVLFGQKPDSLIRAFTETYKHGFSQLDYMCDNVHCGDHFLCSVGANGHKHIVKPIRYGERLGHKIICNRQLLISNAFEELMQEKLPRIHKVIRNKYNGVGKLIHKYYHFFSIKWVSDAVYFLMKPLELFFLIALYAFDQNPENRINTQYLNAKDRKAINQMIHTEKN